MSVIWKRIATAIVDFMGGATAKIAAIAVVATLIISVGVTAVSSYRSAIAKLASMDIVISEQNKTIKTYKDRIESLENYQLEHDKLIQKVNKDVRRIMEREPKFDEKGNIAADDGILSDLNCMFTEGNYKGSCTANASDSNVQ